MFKNKFKELVQNKKELTEASFEILNDKKAAELSGGCRSLQNCGSFRGGNCPHLKSCKSYDEGE